MSGVYVEVQSYGDGKLLKTPTGEYRYMDADRNVSKKSYADIGQLLDGEGLRSGTEAKKVQERTRRSKGTTQRTDGSDEVVTPIEEQQALVEKAVGESAAPEEPAKKPARKSRAKKA